MPAKKKRKTQHATPRDPSHKSHAQDNLSHDEIWDDSALIRSWNDALAEYDFYHSIHARGEDVEEVLRRAEAEDQQPTALDKDGEIEDGEIPSDDGEDGAGDVGSGARVGPDVLVPSSQPEADMSVDRVEDSFSVASKAGKGLDEALGDALNGEEQVVLTPEQTLERIKMSYYWAGYYSGLYDEQMKAQKQE